MVCPIPTYVFSIYSAEQLALAQRMEEKQSTGGRSKVQRKGSLGGTLKKQKFESQDHLDASSFGKVSEIKILRFFT